jgi:ATP-binding cassette subfamily B protein
MGLLVPNRGQIMIDDTILSEDRYRSWQSNVAHVPQFIFLSDASIAENIAFGIPIELIDHVRVQYVAKLALVDEFVQKYPNQYNTVVGERGINLSGGQRQRIGIARALYKNATVLVFDEATSALDTKTEDEIMTAITSFNRSITLLIIAHRLTSLKGCDFIIEIKNGKLYQKELYQVLNS